MFAWGGWAAGVHADWHMHLMLQMLIYRMLSCEPQIEPLVHAAAVTVDHFWHGKGFKGVGQMSM